MYPMVKKLGKKSSILHDMSTLKLTKGAIESKTFHVAHTPNPCVKINACICPPVPDLRRQETR